LLKNELNHLKNQPVNGIPWKSYARGNTIEVNVNGILQNKGTNVNISEGSICLQSEGKEYNSGMFF
jgi:hypothetical protein